jgi:hypothetical protein
MSSNYILYTFIFTLTFLSLISPCSSLDVSTQETIATPSYSSLLLARQSKKYGKWQHNHGPTLSTRERRGWFFVHCICESRSFWLVIISYKAAVSPCFPNVVPLLFYKNKLGSGCFLSSTAMKSCKNSTMC